MGVLMMYDILFLIGIICAVISVIFLIMAIVVFIASHHSGGKKDIIGDHTDVARQRRVMTVSRIEDQGAPAPAPAAPAAVPKQSSKKISPEFIIEKSIVFVSTDEIM